jgi:DNA-binding HxlR family transcriptional regulator
MWQFNYHWKEGTQKNYTHPKESMRMATEVVCVASGASSDPRVEALVNDLIGRVADKWTMLTLEALAAGGTLRFSRIADAVPGISQKMLTQTLRLMERDGLVTRKIYAVVPPKVEYTLTTLGHGLGEAFCGVWVWAEANLDVIETARQDFDTRAAGNLG